MLFVLPPIGFSRLGKVVEERREKFFFLQQNLYMLHVLLAKVNLSGSNRPLPSSKTPHFQNEARCTILSFICMRIKNDFHIKG